MGNVRIFCATLGKGEYIYDTPNFMGNLSSYLPQGNYFCQVFLFLGNVGYLQVVAFYYFPMLFLEFKSNFHRFLAIGMLGISPAYIYEVVCKSDFISSFIAVAAFIVFWNRMFKDDYFKDPFC